MRGWLAPRLAVLAAAVLFSTGAAAIKATGLPSWQIGSFRSGVAALALGWILWRRGQGRRLVGLGWVPLVYALALTGYVVANKLTTAANTIFLYSTAPVWVLVLAPGLLGEKPRWRDLATLLLVVGGMALIFGSPIRALTTAPDPVTGNRVAAASALLWALTLVGLRRLSRGSGSRGDGRGLAAVVAGNALACLLFLPLALPVAGATGGDVVSVAYLGLVQIGLAYLLLLAGLRRVPAVEGSLLLLLEPVLNPIWAWMLHGEVPGAGALAGGGVILAALAVQVAWRPASAPSSSPGA